MKRDLSLIDVRARVRTRETWELLLLAGGLQNVVFDGDPPKAAIARFKAMQEEVVAELDRRGIVVAPNPDLMAIAMYRGERASASSGGREQC